MEPAEYDYMFKLEDSLWWYVGMRHIVKALLDREMPAGSAPLKVLDAGCGTGGSLKLLERYGQVTSFDFSARAAALYRSREPGRIMVASTDAIPFADASFDLVTSFEVVCQLNAPAAERALSEMARVLKPGGTLLVRVPALQWLYGPHDAAVHTQHRYTAKEIVKRIDATGLKLIKTTYANTWLFPIAVIRRLLARFTARSANGSDVRPVAAPLNLMLSTILSSEALILRQSQLPIGLSVLALARKSLP